MLINKDMNVVNTLFIYIIEYMKGVLHFLFYE